MAYFPSATDAKKTARMYFPLLRLDRFPSLRTENSVHAVFFCIRGRRKIASGLLTLLFLRVEINIVRNSASAGAHYPLVSLEHDETECPVTGTLISMYFISRKGA